MDLIYEIRRRHHVQKQTISEIAREMGLSRPTVRKHLKTVEEPRYKRNQPPAPKLADYQPLLERWLKEEEVLPRPRRRTARRMYECLCEQGYQGAYDSVQRFIKQWKGQRGPKVTEAFVPMVFFPGDACQFDWSHEQVELAGVMQTVKVAHFRLSYSRQMFVAAYPRETQEMVFDAHVKAFAFFGGVPERVIYDNLKSVVDTIYSGKERVFNRRFLVLANHYLFEPIACTPESGWEKGQVENQVGNVREWLFTPLARFGSLDELNEWLARRCTELAQRKHPTKASCTIAECFAEEHPLLRPVTASFDGYVEHLCRVSSTCLVRIDRNRYSVPAIYAGQVVSIRTTAQQIRIVADEQVIACHPRQFGRDQLICDPWHYLPVLEKKPGALRNGAPFVQWQLPAAVQKVRERLMKQSKGDRQFVQLLVAASETSLEALTVACELALEYGTVNSAVILNELRRLTSPERQNVISLAEGIDLAIEPLADCTRYDHLRGGHHVH